MNTMNKTEAPIPAVPLARRVMRRITKFFEHKHRWIDSGFNQWSIATEQRCNCGAYRHHLWVDVRGNNIDWREGRHPKAHNMEVSGCLPKDK